MARVAPETVGASHFDRLVPTQPSNQGKRAIFGRAWQMCTKVCKTQDISEMMVKAFMFVLLVAWTTFRITGNVDKIMNPIGHVEVFYGDHWPLEFQIFDGILRPLICFLSLGLFIFLRIQTALVLISLMGCGAVAALSTFGELVVADPDVPDLAMLQYFRLATRIGSMSVTLAQLFFLHRERVAGCAAFCFVFALLGRLLFEPLFWISWILYAIVVAAALLYDAHLKQKMFQKKMSKDKEFNRNVAKTLWLLRLGAVLTLIDGIYLLSPTETILSTSLSFTLDNLIVFACILVKSGIWARNEMLDQLQILKELGYMARTSGKRIAFPGQVSLASQHCIVSFPGKYADEWDTAVRVAQLRPGAPSLACVFLTDEESGLGRHQQNPEQPGSCWCKAIYGQLPAAAYLSVVEDPSKLTADELMFREADARAMGQIFLKREQQSDEQWQKDKDDAKIQAEEKCEENDGLAPWGCFWFHQWLHQVEEAKRHSQTLHVFYFEDRVGQGKLPWQELSNEASVRRARENGGLGASQTAEVAYLERSGYRFEEHDVKTFYEFMKSHSNDD